MICSTEAESIIYTCYVMAWLHEDVGRSFTSIADSQSHMRRHALPHQMQKGDCSFHKRLVFREFSWTPFLPWLWAVVGSMLALVITVFMPFVIFRFPRQICIVYQIIYKMTVFLSIAVV